MLGGGCAKGRNAKHGVRLSTIITTIPCNIEKYPYSPIPENVWLGLHRPSTRGYVVARFWHKGCEKRGCEEQEGSVYEDWKVRMRCLADKVDPPVIRTLAPCILGLQSTGYHQEGSPRPPDSLWLRILWRIASMIQLNNNGNSGQLNRATPRKKMRWN